MKDGRILLYQHRLYPFRRAVRHEQKTYAKRYPYRYFAPSQVFIETVGTMDWTWN